MKLSLLYEQMFKNMLIAQSIHCQSILPLLLIITGGALVYAWIVPFD